MQTKIKFLDFNALKALVVLAVCSIMFTSCYEKEGIDIVSLPDPVYTITGSLISAADGLPVNGSITINGTAVTTSNGYFSYKASQPGDFVIKVALSGYLDVTRTVYLATAYKGQTSTSNVEIWLYNANQFVKPVPTIDAPASKAEAKAIETAVKTTVSDALKSITGLTAGTISIKTNDDGTSTAIVPFTLPAKKSGAVTVPYYAFKGYSSDITPATKALTRGELFIANASAYLNMAYGMSPVALTVDIAAMEGYNLTGYTVEYIFANRYLTFNVATNPSKEDLLKGCVTYFSRALVFPIYESHDGHDSHDSHDTHDGHGITPSAGGGASFNY